MYERRCNDNSRPKILGYEKRPFRYSDAFMPVGVDGKHRALRLTVSLRPRGPHWRCLSHIPKREPANITKMADTLRPIRPSKSFSGMQAGRAASPSTVDPVAEPLTAAATWRPTRYAKSSSFDMLSLPRPRASRRMSITADKKSKQDDDTQQWQIEALDRCVDSSHGTPRHRKRKCAVHDLCLPDRPSRQSGAGQ